MSHPLTAKPEKFCQLVAAGATYTDAYLEAYQKPTVSNGFPVCYLTTEA